jgi:hypothetical protein
MKRTGLILVALGLFLFAQAAQAQWTQAKRLTWTSGDSFSPATAVDSSNAINVVWADYTPGNSEIFFKRSGDGGTTWSEGKRLTWTSGDSYEPAIGIDSGDTIHVVWDSDVPGNYEIFYMRSSDGGINWSAAQRLTWSSGWSEYPAIAIDSSDTIHVVWQDDKPGNLEIYSIRSSDGGANWSAVKRMTWTSGSSGCPAITRGTTNTIHVVWQDDTPGDNEIYCRKSTDGGSTWSSAKRLTWNSGDSYDPAIARDSGNGIHVVWNDETTGHPEIHYRKSSDGGTTWSGVKRLSWSIRPHGHPALAISSDSAIHVTYEDNASPHYVIFYRKSTDGGAFWGPHEYLSWTWIDSYNPAIASDSLGNLHVVWWAYIPGNVDIFYTKFIK